MRDFRTYPAAPVARQVWTKSASEWTVKKMIFAALPDSRNCLLASIPLRIGMEISETMRSGLRRFAASTMDWPSDTLPTTSHVGSSRHSTMFKNGRWSSANRIRTFPNESAYQIREAWKSLLKCTEGCVGDIRFAHAANPGMLWSLVARRLGG
jgi:hypothetical protein